MSLPCPGSAAIMHRHSADSPRPDDFPWREACRPAKLCGMTTIPAAAGVRAWTAADRLAERYFDEQARLDPITATFAGLAEHADRMTDLSPAGHVALAE